MSARNVQECCGVVGLDSRRARACACVCACGRASVCVCWWEREGGGRLRKTKPTAPSLEHFPSRQRAFVT